MHGETCQSDHATDAIGAGLNHALKRLRLEFDQRDQRINALADYLEDATQLERTLHQELEHQNKQLSDVSAQRAMLQNQIRDLLVKLSKQEDHSVELRHI